MTDRISRRRVLQIGGVSLSTAVGGCTAALRDVSSTDESDVPANATGNASVGRGPDGADDSGESDPDDEVAARDPPELDEPPVSLADAPTPPDPGSYRYATVGTGADVAATVFGNWKCPYTRAFAFEVLPDLVEQYVRPGDVDIAFRSLAYRGGDPFLGEDAPRATRAGLAVWDRDPDAYWSYFGYAFANQSTGERWATADLLTRCAEAAGVSDAGSLDARLRDGDHEEAMADTVAAAEARAVHSVPRIVVEGDVYAPTVDPDAVVDALDDAVGE